MRRWQRAIRKARSCVTEISAAQAEAHRRADIVLADALSHLARRRECVHPAGKWIAYYVRESPVAWQAN